MLFEEKAKVFAVSFTKNIAFREARAFGFLRSKKLVFPHLRRIIFPLCG